MNPDPISSIDHQSYPLLFDSPNLRLIFSALGISSNRLRSFCWTFIFCSLLNVTNGSLTDDDSSAHIGPETIIENEFLYFVWTLIFDLWLNAGRTRLAELTNTRSLFNESFRSILLALLNRGWLWSWLHSTSRGTHGWRRKGGTGRAEVKNDVIDAQG